jgi:Tfp pilus assembly protein FimV
LPARERPDNHWGVRLLAPAAFLVAATVAVLVIRAGLDNDSNPAPRPPAAARPRASPEPATTARRQPQRRTYTIQRGDTLDSVALDQGTTVERLLELNPQIDPTSLQVGQRIVVPTT